MQPATTVSREHVPLLYSDHFRFSAIKSPNKVRFGYFLDMLCSLGVVPRKIRFREKFHILDQNWAKNGHFRPILGGFWAIKPPNQVRLGYFLDMLCILWVVSSKDGFQEKISFFGLKFGQKWPFWANFGGFWTIKSPFIKSVWASFWICYVF